MDGSCRELYFGRDEIARYFLNWNGKFIRLSAVPAKKTKERYANAGRPEWFDAPKLLVRRTGDFVMAAIDKSKRYASNNFFVVVPKSGAAGQLEFLCGLLNSHFVTWLFRTIEPRKGRVFAEIKIKHLSTFPIPKAEQAGRDKLVLLVEKIMETRQQSAGAVTDGEHDFYRNKYDALDRQMNALIHQLYGLTAREIQTIESEIQ